MRISTGRHIEPRVATIPPDQNVIGRPSLRLIAFAAEQARKTTLRTPPLNAQPSVCV
jgi:hypothetical protein